MRAEIKAPNAKTPGISSAACVGAAVARRRMLARSLLDNNENIDGRNKQLHNTFLGYPFIPIYIIYIYIRIYIFHIYSACGASCYSEIRKILISEIQPASRISDKGL